MFWIASKLNIIDIWSLDFSRIFEAKFNLSSMIISFKRPYSRRWRCKAWRVWWMKVLIWSGPSRSFLVHCITGNDHSEWVEPKALQLPVHMFFSTLFQMGWNTGVVGQVLKRRILPVIKMYYDESWASVQYI